MMKFVDELWNDSIFHLFTWMILIGVIINIQLYFNDFLDEGRNPCKYQKQIRVIGNIIFTTSLAYSLVRMIIEFIKIV